MDHAKYSNILKALLHCHSTVHSFYSDVSVVYEDFEDLIQIQLFVDSYETHLNVFSGEGAHKLNLLKMRVVNFETLNMISWEEATTRYSYVNMLMNNEFGVINYIELKPDVVVVQRRSPKTVEINKDCIDEQYFQYSTVDDIGPIEDYYYMANMYDYYHEFVPQGKEIMVRYNKNESFCTDDFRDFVAKKVWGIISLA